jgi:hypothetical protein
MHIQVLAYEFMDHWQLQVTSAEAFQYGYSWTQLINVQLMPPPDAEIPWDIVWAIGQELCEAALRRGAQG